MAVAIEKGPGILRRLFARNWVTMFGASLTTSSVLAIVFLIILGTLGRVDSPYIGIITFLILPGVFILGLLIIPIGAFWGRELRTRVVEGGLTIDLRKQQTRHALGLIAFLTVANLFIISSLSYKGVEYMDSVEFCGKVCHSVMAPEHTAFLNSPHSRVHCVECHIGPGAPWFVKAKLSGTRQVLAVLFDTYHKPIVAPVEDLRPSRDTCEQCHWPDKFAGDRMKVSAEFSDDEANTRLTTALLLHIGGGSSDAHGIHSWHIAPGRETKYLPAAPDRQTISLVRVKEADGTVKNFAPPGFEGDPAAVPDENLRTMDCIDCHNRPTHIYEMPGKAMDKALANGKIDSSLPFIKTLGVETLQAVAEAPSQEEGAQQIAQKVQGFYQEKYPDLITAQGEAIQKSIAELQGIYQRNIFPQMKVTWGTYPDNIGHQDFPGCFRCHDDSHATTEGETVSQDCTICHAVLAWQEENPEIVGTLGIH